MLDPYKMVLVNLIGLTALVIGILAYKFINPQKKINLFVLLIIISILPIVSIFRTGAYESGDFNIHVRRTMEFYSLLSQGNFMPSWAGDLNATYGYPLFTFNYTLPYYIISLFHLLGFSFITSLKLFLALCFVFSGIYMYLFSKNFFKNPLAGFCASIFYLFAPYHLISLHFKITIGEILAYTLIPLTFFFAGKFLINKKPINFLLSGLFLGLVMQSHIFVGLFLIPVLSLYIIFESKYISKGALNALGIIIISLLTSMYQWAAPFIYRSYLFTTTYPIDPSKAFYFPNIIDLLYSPWRSGLLFQGPKGELSFLLGYAQLFALLVIIVLIIKNKINKKYRKTVLLWVFLFFATVFLITPYSISIWRHLPFINTAGSQRLIIIVAFYTSLFAGYISLAYGKKKLIIYGLIIFAITTTVLNWGQRRVIPTIDDSTLKRDLSLGVKWGDAHYYALPKWVSPTNPWFSYIPKNHLEVIKGKAIVMQTHRSSTKHVYTVNAQTNIILKENTLYFPGWIANSSGKEVMLEPDKNGVINLKLLKGDHTLQLTYKDLPLFALSKIISIITFFSILIYTVFYLFKNRLIKFPKF